MFYKPTEFFLAEMIAQLYQGGRRILLANNVEAGWSSCGWSGSSVLEFSFQMDSLV